MGSYARFEHYLTALDVETCPEFWPPTPVSGPLCGGGGDVDGGALAMTPSPPSLFCFASEWRGWERQSWQGAVCTLYSAPVGLSGRRDLCNRCNVASAARTS